MIEPSRQAELEAEGWTARFVADEPRLGEAVELYRSLGLDVHIESVRTQSVECASCLEACPDHYKLIFTRPSDRRESLNTEGEAW